MTSGLNRLGFRILHYPHDPKTFEELKRGVCRLSVLDDYDGITDIPAVPLYRDLARAYPRAKFVLTVRDEAEWLSSIRAHWLRFPSHAPSSPDPRVAHEDMDAGEESAYAFRQWTRAAALGVTEFDAEALSKRRVEHQRDVEAFFQDAPERLLVLRICDGEGWEELCSFLDRPIPQKDFPWNHSAVDRASEPLPR